MSFPQPSSPDCSDAAHLPQLGKLKIVFLARELFPTYNFKVSSGKKIFFQKLPKFW